MHLYEHEFLLLLDRLPKAEQELYQARTELMKVSREVRKLQARLDEAEGFIKRFHRDSEDYFKRERSELEQLGLK